MGLWDRVRPDFISSLRAANPQLTDAQVGQLSDRLQAEIESQPHPRVAFIGATGVGKSTTLNSLFNAGVEISHSLPCTQSPVERKFSAQEYIGARGSIVVFDMPGLGEDIDADERHYAAYERVLPEVDVAVWIFPGEHREMTPTQHALIRLSKTLGSEIHKKMVFALNKVDLIHPGPEDWNRPANMPSEEQVRYMHERSQDIAQKVKKVAPRWEGEVIPYSAVKRYRLPHLMNSILDSASKNRAWLFGSRAEVADFRELVDPRLLEAARRVRDDRQVLHEQ